MDFERAFHQINSEDTSLKNGKSKNSNMTSWSGRSSSCTFSHNESTPDSQELISKSQSNSTKSRPRRDPHKTAKIQEMKNKASALQKELEETEVRSAHLRRIKELENELVKLSDEEVRRVSQIGNKSCFSATSATQPSEEHCSLQSKPYNKSEHEFDQVKRFCGQIRNGELQKGTETRFSGGANCAPCALKAFTVYEFNETRPASRIRYGNQAFNLATDINLQRVDISQSLDAIAGKTGGDASGGTGGGSGQNPGEQAMEEGKGTKVKDLVQLVEELMAEIGKVRRKNANNRRKIIELCLAMKQKEAAIRECSELLCHIMHDGDDAASVIEEVQSAQLEKHIEYLRWILIRLQFESMAQETEISHLVLENDQKDLALKECRDTKHRICSQKQAKESALLAFTTAGGCDLPLSSIETPQKRN